MDLPIIKDPHLSLAKALDVCSLNKVHKLKGGSEATAKCSLLSFLTSFIQTEQRNLYKGDGNYTKHEDNVKKICNSRFAEAVFDNPDMKYTDVGIVSLESEVSLNTYYQLEKHEEYFTLECFIEKDNNAMSYFKSKIAFGRDEEDKCILKVQIRNDYIHNYETAALERLRQFAVVIFTIITVDNAGASTFVQKDNIKILT